MATAGLCAAGGSDRPSGLAWMHVANRHDCTVSQIVGVATCLAAVARRSLHYHVDPLSLSQVREKLARLDKVRRIEQVRFDEQVVSLIHPPGAGMSLTSCARAEKRMLTLGID